MEYIVKKCRNLQSNSVLIRKAIPSFKRFSRRPHGVGKCSIPRLYVVEFK